MKTKYRKRRPKYIYKTMNTKISVMFLSVALSTALLASQNGPPSDILNQANSEKADPAAFAARPGRPGGYFLHPGPPRRSHQFPARGVKHGRCGHGVEVARIGDRFHKSAAAQFDVSPHRPPNRDRADPSIRLHPAVRWFSGDPAGGAFLLRRRVLTSRFSG